LTSIRKAGAKEVLRRMARFTESSFIRDADSRAQDPPPKKMPHPIAIHSIAAAALCLAFSVAAADTTPRLADAVRLRPGEYVWHPEVAPDGPVVVVVSLDEQRVYVYRNGIAIGLSTISSGRKGHETPPGVFTILQKDRDHRSNLYDDAPMPYMERLTWDGVALHGGTLPGYPASHGCVRLPHAFAEKLFEITQRGETVVVANSKAAPAAVVHPAVLAPVSPAGETQDHDARADAWSWDEDASPHGPVSILVSTGDRLVVVLRNGIRIGSAPLQVKEGFELAGSELFVMSEGLEDSPSPLDPERPRHRWAVFPIAGDHAPLSMDQLAGNLSVAPDFALRLYSILTPGTTVVVTKFPAVREKPLQAVLDAVSTKE
jgi:L,D-transpeptidase catalytic domain